MNEPEPRGKLISECPWVLGFWHQDNTISPETTVTGSKRVVRWRCPEDHDWESPVNRVLSVGSDKFCIACLSYAHLRPELLPRWADDRSPWDVLATGGRYRPILRCQNGHKRRSQAKTVEIIDDRCNQCSLEDHEPDRYAMLVTKTFVPKSDKSKRQFRCSEGHLFVRNPWAKISLGSFCPMCVSLGSFADHRPELLKYWDDACDPTEVTARACLKVSFRCELGHPFTEWLHRIHVISRDFFCPRCSEIKNLLINTNPEVAARYSPLNDIAVDTLSHKSQQKFLWTCNEGHLYRSSVRSEVSRGDLCLRCVGNRSVGETHVLRQVEARGFWVDSNSRSVIPPYELDIYIPALSAAIEFNGEYWHSNRVISDKRGLCSADYHDAKVTACANSGIRLLTIWEHEWLEHQEGVLDRLDEFLDGSVDGAATENIQHFSVMDEPCPRCGHLEEAPEDIENQHLLSQGPGRVLPVGNLTTSPP